MALGILISEKVAPHPMPGQEVAQLCATHTPCMRTTHTPLRHRPVVVAHDLLQAAITQAGGPQGMLMRTVEGWALG
jgi:hypothetical protein